MLLRVPILGGWVERRWMPDPVERDRHRELVRERLQAPTPSDPPPVQLGTPDAPQLTGSGPED